MTLSKDGIVQELIPLRKYLNYSETIFRLTGNRINQNSAMAVLIQLVVLTFTEADEKYLVKRDVVLSSWALLRECSDTAEVIERRKKYIIATGYNGKENPDLTFLSFNPDEQEYKKEMKRRSDRLLKLETRLYEVIADYCIANLISDNEVSELINEAESNWISRENNELRIPSLSNYKTTVSRAFAHQKRSLEDGTTDAFNLPLANEWFVGRNSELEELQKGFDDGSRIQILYGADGVGKTQVALEYAHRHKSEYDAIVWIDAASPELIRKSCLKVLEYLSKYKLLLFDKNYIREFFINHLSVYSNFLLIFDNADYLNKETEYAIKMTNELRNYFSQESGNIIITTNCDYSVDWANRLEITKFKRNISIIFLETMTGLPKDISTDMLADELGDFPLALDYASAYIRKQHCTYSEYLGRWCTLRKKAFCYQSPEDNAILLTLKLSLGVTYMDSILFDKAGIILYLASLSKESFISKSIFTLNNSNTKLQILFRDNNAVDEAIAFLVEYSLAKEDGNNIYIHPLLRRISHNIFGKDSIKRYSRSESLSLYNLAIVYWLNNDTEIAKYYAYKALTLLANSPKEDLIYISYDITDAFSKNKMLIKSVMETFFSNCNADSIRKVSALRKAVFSIVNDYFESDSLCDAYTSVDFIFLTYIATAVNRCILTRRLPFWKDQENTKGEYAYLVVPPNEKVLAQLNNDLSFFVDLWIDDYKSAKKALKKYFKNTEECFQIIALPEKINDEKTRYRFEKSIQQLR